MENHGGEERGGAGGGGVRDKHSHTRDSSSSLIALLLQLSFTRFFQAPCGERGESTGSSGLSLVLSRSFSFSFSFSGSASRPGRPVCLCSVCKEDKKRSFSSSEHNISCTEFRHPCAAILLRRVDNLSRFEMRWGLQ